MSTFSSQNRIKKNTHFRYIFRNGVRFNSGCISFFYLLSTIDPAKKLGIAVSKKQGNAVERNAFKRSLRELFRVKKTNLPDYFQIIIRSNKPLSEIKKNELTNDFQSFVEQVESFRGINPAHQAL